MGYAHILNLYKDQTILLFRECYALEKVHGTSAHLQWKDGRVIFFAGGENHKNFCGLFDEAALKEKFTALGHPNVVIYGEAYGGKQQGQSWRYGKSLKFVVFDVRVEDRWLTPPEAEKVALDMGLEFVHYERIPADLEHIDACRDAPSVQAKRNGVEGDQPREGVVLRPIQEFTLAGERSVCKHKREAERETTTPRKVDDPSKLKVLEEAEAIANEWVTPTRLEHVLQKLPEAKDLSAVPKVIEAMIEDVLREGAGEIVDSKEARKAIGAKAVKLFKQHIRTT